MQVLMKLLEVAGEFTISEDVLNELDAREGDFFVRASPEADIPTGTLLLMRPLQAGQEPQPNQLVFSPVFRDGRRNGGMAVGDSRATTGYSVWRNCPFSVETGHVPFLIFYTSLIDGTGQRVMATRWPVALSETLPPTIIATKDYLYAKEVEGRIVGLFHQLGCRPDWGTLNHWRRCSLNAKCRDANGGGYHYRRVAHQPEDEWHKLFLIQLWPLYFAYSWATLAVLRRLEAGCGIVRVGASLRRNRL